MRIINLAQRTPAWAEWRQAGVSASDAAVLLDRSPYKTRWQLWAERVGLRPAPDLSRNPHVRRGIELEAKARAAFSEQHPDIWLPLCAESDKESILRASFDGLNSQGEPVELKCPSDTVFQQIRSEGLSAEAAQQYLPQLQFQLCVAEARRGWLAFFCEDTLLSFEIERDTEMIEQLQQAALTFWQQVTRGTAPPLDPQRDLCPISGPAAESWSQLAQQYRAHRLQLTQLESECAYYRQQLKALQDELLPLLGNFARGEAAGLRLTRSLVRGRVDYPKLLHDQLGEVPESLLQSYRTPSSERIQITLHESSDTDDGSAETCSSHPSPTTSVFAGPLPDTTHTYYF